MHDTSYPTRARAAYCRAMARHRRADFPRDELPSWTGEETMAARDDVVCHGSRTLVVYRRQTDGPLRRLKRWPKALDRPLA